MIKANLLFPNEIFESNFRLQARQHLPTHTDFLIDFSRINSMSL